MRENSTIEQYQYKSLKFVLIIYTISAVFAGIMFLLLKAIGIFSDIQWISLILLSVLMVFEVSTFLIMYRITTHAGDHFSKWFQILKIIILVFSYINYIYLCFTIPSKELWCSVFYFMMLGALFLDQKLNIAFLLIGSLCQAAVFVLNPATLPNKENLVMELVLRCIVIGLLSFGIFILTNYASGLLNVVEKREIELNKNNESNLILFQKLSEYAQSVLSSSENLSQIATEESVSIEEIAGTSQDAQKDSDIMLTDVTENNKSLNQLLDTNKVITEKVNDTEQGAKQLIELSSLNENALNETLTIITQIKDDIKNTLEATHDLEEKSNQIDSVLQFIHEISTQTNLLSLNANIEAARAGEHGKGFSVVADEIRKLAESTHQSLNEVESITQEFKERVTQVKGLMSVNTEKISHGNTLLVDVVTNIKNMIGHLKTSGKNINEINTLTNSMLSETQKVVEFNSKVSESTNRTMENFNTVFNSINQNLAMSEELAGSAETLKSIAEDMNKLIN